MNKAVLIIAAIITAGMAFVAILTGSVGMAVLVAAMIVVFVLGIILNRAVSRKVTASLSAVENSNTGEGITAIVAITNGGAMPVFRGVVKLTVKNMNFRFSMGTTEVFSVGPNSTRELKIHIKSEFCGQYRITLDSVKCMDIWGLTGVEVYCGEEAFACMFPRRHLVGSVSEAVKQTYEKEKKFAGRRNNTLSDILQYRDYQKGDSLKNVNWKLSVKHDQLLVREFDTPIDNRMMIVLGINKGSARQQNLAYEAMFSISAEYLRRGMAHQICWPDGKRLITGNAENMDDLLKLMRQILSTRIRPDAPAYDLFENQERIEKYAKIIYVTNGINQSAERRIRTWGNAEVVTAGDIEDLKRLAV